MLESIANWEIEKAKVVLENHLVSPLTREGVLENLYFCILSQATPWEFATKIINRLRKESKDQTGTYTGLDLLSDKKNLNGIIKDEGWRFHHNNRLDSAVDYFSNRKDEYWYDVIGANKERREVYVGDVKWLSRKTFSFWHICLGGKNMIALDVYVNRGLNQLGISMNQNFHVTKGVGVNNQKLRITPGKSEYLRIEDEARKLFSKDGRFSYAGGVDLSLVDTYLWWKGANRGSLNQLSLFNCLEEMGRDESFKLPYAIH